MKIYFSIYLEDNIRAENMAVISKIFLPLNRCLQNSYMIFLGTSFISLSSKFCFHTSQLPLVAFPSGHIYNTVYVQDFRREAVKAAARKSRTGEWFAVDE
jgi:hypothetical protein